MNIIEKQLPLKTVRHGIGFLLATIICCWLPQESPAAWQAGVARKAITPSEPIWMAGYASRDKPATGKLTELWAKVLVLRDDDGQQAALISLDLIGIDRALSQSICNQLSRRYGLRREQIAICCSHTHTGPVVAKNLRPMHFEMLTAKQQQQIDGYADYLEQTIVSLVGQSIADLRQVDLFWGEGRANFAVNRRNNPEQDVPRLRTENQLVGPVDHAVPVLSIRDGEQQKAIVFGYACHATVLSSYEWSGDYPGFAQIEIEAAYPNCVAMFWAGCGADQNPLPRRSVELAKEYGTTLAKSVISAVNGPLSKVAGKLETTYEEIDLPFDELPTEKELEDEATSKNRYLAARARTLLQNMRQGHPLPQTYPYPIAHWKLGDQVRFVLLGGEVVVDFAIKTKTRFPGAWIAGYTNDVMAYIPSKRVWLEGGYEGAGAMMYYGLPTRWHSSVEDVIHAEIDRQLKDATPKQKP
ncbi:MAG: neutral/alkaline non-lysosomal ceramidase N-terminal domain-containing protein [Pirellulaceae bacterium]|nr:neutral/alkaline non-lysosomal ceramidase N-terminal domain-containing protein [Pirellulaceae bacterium]